MQGDGCGLVVQQIEAGLSHHTGWDLDLVVCGVVHEHVVLAVEIKVLHVPAVDGGGVHLRVGVECLVDDLARQHILQLRAYNGVALARFVVLEPLHLPQLTVQVEHHSVLQVIGGYHACRLSDSACKGRRGILPEPYACPETAA